MLKRALVVLISLILVGCVTIPMSPTKPVAFAVASASAKPTPTGHYYFTVKSANATNGKLAYVGPYPTLSQCTDTAGSAIYSHPWGCHLGKNPAIFCVNTGNGFAYPAGYAYPAPTQLVSNGCQQILDDASIKVPKGNYFIYADQTGASLEACSNLKKMKLLAATNHMAYIGNYSDMKCPGAPCFGVGHDNACN